VIKVWKQLKLKTFEYFLCKLKFILKKKELILELGQQNNNKFWLTVKIHSKVGKSFVGKCFNYSIKCETRAQNHKWLESIISLTL
jgi:hypothetical protein